MAFAKRSAEGHPAPAAIVQARAALTAAIAAVATAEDRHRAAEGEWERLSSIASAAEEAANALTEARINSADRDVINSLVARRQLQGGAVDARSVALEITEETPEETRAHAEAVAARIKSRRQMQAADALRDGIRAARDAIPEKAKGVLRVGGDAVATALLDGLDQLETELMNRRLGLHFLVVKQLMSDDMNKAVSRRLNSSGCDYPGGWNTQGPWAERADFKRLLAYLKALESNPEGSLPTAAAIIAGKF
jgi:hypothetical protein